MWNAGNLIFGYCELDDDLVLLETEKEIIKGLIQAFKGTFEWISEPEQNMKLMYHDYGIVRTNKELIRHRGFMAKLNEGCEQEYKRRHDELIKQRGNFITPGPDSNFSIWSAGGYIFGYDEIDFTMEREQTKEELESTIAWETKQLEIMKWITNDMDWLTGENNLAVKRIAWHN